MDVLRHFIFDLDSSFFGNIVSVLGPLQPYDKQFERKISFFFSPLTGWKERKKERKNETKSKIKIKRKYKILESDTDVDDDGLSPFSVRNSLTSNVDLFHFEPLSPPPPPLSPIPSQTGFF